jgi:hypothetical protein
VNEVRGSQGVPAEVVARGLHVSLCAGLNDKRNQSRRRLSYFIDNTFTRPYKPHISSSASRPARPTHSSATASVINVRNHQLSCHRLRTHRQYQLRPFEHHIIFTYSSYQPISRCPTPPPLHRPSLALRLLPSPRCMIPHTRRRSSSPLLWVNRTVRHQTPQTDYPFLLMHSGPGADSQKTPILYQARIRPEQLGSE